MLARSDMTHFIRRRMRAPFRCGVLLVTSLLVLLCDLSKICANSMEDDYIKYFGNITQFRMWMEARKWYLEDDEPLMRKFCSEAHNQSGRGSYPVDWLLLTNRVLQFEHPEYVSRRVDIVEYAVYDGGVPTTKATTRWWYRETGTWQITEGRGPNCVYYLKVVNASQSEPIFGLKEEVCNINIEDDVLRIPI